MVAIIIKYFTNFLKTDMPYDIKRKIFDAYIALYYPVNERGSNETPPLCVAIKLKLSNVAHTLLSKGADVHNRGKSGLNAFELAIAYNQPEVAKWIYDQGYPYKPGQRLESRLSQYSKQFTEFDRKYLHD